MRGAWIEIFKLAVQCEGDGGRSPCGERGLKSLDVVHDGVGLFVAPHAGSVD